jgi:SAM-dependent methyltransferase
MGVKTSHPAEYPQRWPVLADPRSRLEKAAKIRAVLREFRPDGAAGKTCVDLGCGSGIIAADLSSDFDRVIACDLDRDAIEFARTKYRRPNLTFIVGDATRVPLASEICDFIVCSHVYEHVESAERLVEEIDRLLKADGMCFFAGPNLLRPREPHLNVWFLHWLPRPVTNAMLRRLGRGPYLERLRTYWGLSHLLARFHVQDVTPFLVREPERFHVVDEPGMRFARRLPDAVLPPLLALGAPSFNFLLTKPSETRTP